MQWFVLFAQNDGGDAACGFGGLACGFGVVWLLAVAVGIAATVFWIWALIDAIRNPSLDGNMRLVWVLVILFTHLLGAILYWFIGRASASRSSA